MVVPDLSKMTPDQALAALKQAGWSADPNALVQTAKEDPNQALWGTITAQNPAVNAKVSKTSVINVTVASEPHVPMPDLTGQDGEPGLRRLERTGLARPAARHDAQRADAARRPGEPDLSIRARTRRT